MLAALDKPYQTSTKVGGRRFDLTAVPVFDTTGKRLGTAVEWRDMTQQHAVQTEVTGLVEKPAPGTEPSTKIISGRYILQPEVMRTLEAQEAGAGGEIQLTDAMARMIGGQPFHAVTFAGRRFDCGSKVGFVEATLALALEREDMGAEVRAMAERLLAAG